MDELYLTLVAIMALAAIGTLAMVFGCWIDGYFPFMDPTTCGPWPTPEPSKLDTAKEIWNNWN